MIGLGGLDTNLNAAQVQGQQHVTCCGAGGSKNTNNTTMTASRILRNRLANLWAEYEPGSNRII